MINDILELREIIEQKNHLLRREARLSAPTLRDQELLPQLHQWFTQLCRDGRPIYRRRQFILIALQLYAPAVLAGQRIPKGLRQHIADAAGFSDSTFISHNIDTLFFHYRHYTRFREETDRLHTRLLDRLRQEGHLPPDSRKDA
ncbi:MAG: hypothetical protein J1E02_07915 [Coprobacter sp.]|nr:hypothetical protein [Coprobacter sp.]